MDRICCASYSHEKIPGTVPDFLSTMSKWTTLPREAEGEAVRGGKQLRCTQSFIHLTLHTPPSSQHSPMYPLVTTMMSIAFIWTLFTEQAEQENSKSCK